MKRTGVRIAGIVLFLLIAVYVVLQLYNVFSPSYITSAAVMYNIDDEIETNGAVVRSEKVSSSQQGTMYFCVNDGEKVAKGAIVAERYGSASDAENSMKLEQLEKELKMVESLSNEGRGNVNVDSVRRSIYSLIGNFSGEISNHDYSAAVDFSNDLVSLLSSYSLATGREIDVTEYMKTLKDAMAELKSRTKGATGTVKSDLSGYFISYSDGCETLFDINDLDEINVDVASDLINKCEDAYSTDNSRFRIVDDYDWYYITVVEAADVTKLRIGNKYNVEFPSVSGEITGTVYSITYDESGERAVIVIGFDRVIGEYLKLRNEKAIINFSNYSGIRVERSSIRMIDGETGVFIKYGSTVKFRKLDIIFETDEYVISKLYTGSSRYLSLYDEIIVTGKDLYIDKNIG